MAMAGVLGLWNEWEIQILVFVSFALQVLLLSFAWMRRRRISHVLRILLWLMYLLAEFTATYTLGHMSIGGKAGEHQQLMAFWAPFLLTHLGGQDTITAYAMEDSQLWLRHLLTFAVQALGAGYVLYKYIGGSRPLIAPAVLMFTVGVLKNAERVWALSFSRLEIIRRYLDGVSIKQEYLKGYPGSDCLLPREVKQKQQKQLLPQHQQATTPSSDGDDRQPKSGTCWDFCLGLAGGLRRCLGWWRKWKPRKKRPEPDNVDADTRIVEKLARKSSLDNEFFLQGAHDLLYICMGQFVDDKIFPSEFQLKAMKYFHDNRRTFQLYEMQLSLMYDIFYTKAAVIHTWYGRCFRAISLLGTATAFFLFQFSSGGSKGGYNRVDATVTHILVAGALVTEAASLLRAMGSTWTCALLRERDWRWLHSLLVSLRRYARIARGRRWSDSIGQFNLLDSYSYRGNETTASDDEEAIIDDETSRRRREAIAKYKRDRRRRLCGGGLGSKIFSFWRDGRRSTIPTGAKELVLEEIQRIVDACKGEEDVMMSYRGQCTLKKQLDRGFRLQQDAITGINFDQSILAWHLATDKFLLYSTYDEGDSLVEATKAVSIYMMFLLVECPYMLPSPVRPTLRLQARKVLRERHYWRRFIGLARDSRPSATTTSNVVRRVTDPGAKLADELLCSNDKGVLRMVFGVLVEMMCYAAHHCSRESHARQLNNGGEFLTTVWLLTTAEFNRVYDSQSRSNFRERQQGSIWNFFNFVDFADFMEPVLESCWSAFVSWSTSMSWSAAFMSWLSSVSRSRSAFMQFILMSCSVIFSLIFLPIRGIIFLLRSPWRPQYYD